MSAMSRSYRLVPVTAGLPAPFFSHARRCRNYSYSSSQVFWGLRSQVCPLRVGGGSGSSDYASSTRAQLRCRRKSSATPQPPYLPRRRTEFLCR